MYKEILIACLLVLNPEGTQAVLDLPFPVFHQEVVHKGVNYGPYPLPKELAGEEVLALVTVSTQERTITLKDKSKVVAVANSEALADKYEGKITDFQKDERVAKNWTLTKAEAFATVTTTDKDGKETTVTTLYDGTDKAELAAFYPSTVLTTAKVVEREQDLFSE